MNEVVVQNNNVSFIDSIDTQTVVATMQKIATLQAVVQKTLRDGHDYGVIPGTGKPTMFKPGGEKICMMFGLTPQYEFMDKIENYKDGFFAYNVKCTLYKDESAVSQGVGSCNSWEKKYRYINSDTIPEGVDPSTAKQFTDKYGRVKYKISNPDPCDLVNTILKMAKKRAFIDAVLQVASLSEVFTQDLEDMKEYVQQEEAASSANMTLEQAEKMKLNFGKYKGMELKDVLADDPGYFEWLAGKAHTEIIKNACQMMLISHETLPKQEPVPQATPAPQSAPPTQDQIDLMANDSDLPF